VLLVTLFGLVGLFVGSALTWRHMENASLALPYLTLAVGGLFLAALIPKQRLAWFVIVPIAALAGLPLTAGFYGLALLYDAWLEDGRLILVLITGLLCVPFITAAILVSIKNNSENHMPITSTWTQIRIFVGLLLPTIGLLTFPNFDLSELNWISIVAIFLSAILGVVLSQYSKLVGKIQTSLNSTERIRLPQEEIYLALITISRKIRVIIRDAAAIFEGEGGMLWLLVLVLIVWLAVRG